jgi:hypothetical protein
MALTVKKVELWSAAIDDRAGGAARKIGPLAQAGADFEFVFARRTPEQPGKGLVIVAPVKGARVVRAAQEAGFQKSTDVFGLRVEGADKPGAGAKMLAALSGGGISFRGISAVVLGTKFVAYLALDSAGDAAKAATLIKKSG